MQIGIKNKPELACKVDVTLEHNPGGVFQNTTYKPNNKLTHKQKQTEIKNSRGLSVPYYRILDWQHGELITTIKKSRQVDIAISCNKVVHDHFLHIYILIHITVNYTFTRYKPSVKQLITECCHKSIIETFNDFKVN